jgi:hypothetical protein
MEDEAIQNSMQSLEQTMSTVFACRSVVKYNSALSEEQKKELLNEIDISLHYLRESLIEHASVQTKPQRPQFQQAVIPSPTANLEKPNREQGKHAALQELYRIYYTYIDAKQCNNISTFVVHFDAVVLALNEVQHLLEKNQDVFTQSTEDPLRCIRAFIADLYYIFMELVRNLSNTLEENNIHIETDEHTSLQEAYSSGGEQDTFSLQCLAPLSDVYAEHQRLNVSSRIKESMAFLIYLEESLAEALPKHTEIVSHLYEVSTVLGDLSYLIARYEDVVGLMLEAR